MPVSHKPEWLKARGSAAAMEEMAALMQSMKLNTVCNEANCPNMGECFQRHTATFMILGSRCTRNCRFCNVTHARPEAVDPDEPANLAATAKKLGLKHVVITQVTRDDLPDGGASQFAACLNALHRTCPDATVEVLVSDMKGDHSCLDTVLSANPDVLNHNVETVEALYPAVRPQAVYSRSLDVLRYCKRQRPDIRVKTGFMVGLGETAAQVDRLMDDIRATGCDILTIGQYLQPSPAHYPLKRYVTPGEFERYREIALEKGFSYVASAPLVRSSYRAAEAIKA